MLVFGGLDVVRQDLVALDLADDGQGIDIAACGPGQRRAELRVPIQAGRFIVFAHGIAPFRVFP